MTRKRNLENGALEHSLCKAKELEKKYEWLLAAEKYIEASRLSLDAKDILKAAELQERAGFCFYRAAFQAGNYGQFESLIKQSINASKGMIEYFENDEKKDSLARLHKAKASIANLASWLEEDPSAKQLLIVEWWELEEKAIKNFEEACDNLSAGKAYNDLLEGLASHRMFWLDWTEKAKDYLVLCDKAIATLLKTEDNYELARAYSIAAFYYGFCVWHKIQEEKTSEFKQKCSSFSEKALLLSEKIGDAYLLGNAYNGASIDALFCHDNPILALELISKAITQSEITKDKRLIGMSKSWASWISLVFKDEDPDEHRKRMEQSLDWATDSINNLKAIGWPLLLFPSHRNYIESLIELASLETNPDDKRTLLKTAVDTGREFLENFKWQENILYWAHQIALIRAFYMFSKTETNITKKRQIIEEGKTYSEKLATMFQRILPFFYLWRARTQNYLAMMETELAQIEPNPQSKLVILGRAVSAMEKCLDIAKKDEQINSIGWESGSYGEFYYKFGEILNQLYDLTKEKKVLEKAAETYANAAAIFSKVKLTTHTAESHWQIAKVHSRLVRHQNAASSYSLAAESYGLAAKEIPQLGSFYSNYSKYMLAWMEIEQAKYAHSIEDYIKANQHYEKAANLHESTDQWNYLAANYFAWASVEEAERLSRQENTQQSKIAFQKALGQFAEAEDSIRQEIGKITSSEEKELTLRLLEASDLRRRFCQARIQIEEAKLLDRQGEYLQSSKDYLEAASELESIIKKVGSEAEQKELELLATLCHAWEKMATGDETASSESYLMAARLFEQAKEHCYTKKASLWALGNSSFCKGLAAGIRYKTTMDMKENILAKRYIKDAASSYFEAGFENASEYAKATLRLFDAYVFMNQAEGEINPEKKAKQYQMAENLLQIAAGSFMKTEQPEKTAQVQRILKTVREEKKLAISLTEVMQAPTITSSTFSFTAPTPTNETSVGLESFQHANVQANLIAGMKEVKVGESFCLSIEFVNAGKEPALLTRVEDFVPKDFVVIRQPEIYRLEESCLNMKGKQIAPLKLVEAKLVLQPSKKGIYQLKPTVHYLDELGQTRSLQLKSVEIKVEEIILADRVSTGTKELDSLLLGGIPKGYAVVLTGIPSDERELLIKNFLEAGTKENQTSFYVTTEAVGIENLLEKSGFYLFLCNPKPKVEVPDLPNVTKLRSKTDINNLNMALARESRNLQAQQSPKRLCIEIISDVLVEYGVKTTRKWISELLTDLCPKGFTVLAVLNSGMHTFEEANAITYLFDGEINLSQAEDPLECRKSVMIKKLRGQDYIKNPICLASQI